jgi:hypothetical protein
VNEPDFLDISTPARQENERAGLEFAKLYLVFETDLRAKRIFEHWKESFLHKRTPTSATIQEYAANEAVRAFIAGIEGQLKIARTRE